MVFLTESVKETNILTFTLNLKKDDRNPLMRLG